MPITIRPITEADAPACNAVVGIVACEKKYLTLTERPPIDGTIAYLQKMINNRFPLLGAFDGDALVGWCDIAGGERESLAHAGTLGMGLLPAYRGQGLGDKLIREALVAGWARGFTRIQLGVLASNVRALKLYRKLGFVEEGRQRNYLRIDGVYHDDILMALLLE